MRNKIFCLLISLCTFLNLEAQQLSPKDEAQILGILDTQNKAWNSGDIESFMNGYWESDSLMFTGSSGITYGYDQTKQNYYRRYPNREAMGQLTFKVITIRKLGKKAATMVGKWDLKRSIGDIGGYFTLIFRKINGSWVIVSDHTS